jgi:hypothetical protein
MRAKQKGREAFHQPKSKDNKTYFMKTWSLFIACMFAISAYAQQAKPAVVAGCGGSSQAIAGYTISFTVGEPVIITADNGAIFTQGFHQPLSVNDYPLITLNLRGEVKNNYIQLDWTTSSETDNAWFYIERGENGIRFTTIDSVSTKAVNGNSTTPLNYTFTDLQPLNGVNHYRLKQVSKNGLVRYSETIQVSFSAANWRAAIYPNPVSSNLYLQLFTDRQTKATITLHGLAGQLIMKREYDLPIGYSKQTLYLGHMKAGMYILTVRDNTNRDLHVKLIKR